MNCNKLDGKIKEYRYNYGTLSVALSEKMKEIAIENNIPLKRVHINPITLSNKLQKKSVFSVIEVMAFTELLKLTDEEVLDIFLTPNLQKAI